ncbi:MAG: hypothetical protein QOJ46_1158 [bacterium]|jgi:hypothetical protein
MSDLPPGLEDFGARLEQAAQRDIAERRRASRGRRRLRDIGLPVGAALAAAAVSAGAVHLVDRQGAPIAPERGGGTAFQPGKDPAVIEATATADPSGGPPWVVRAYTTPSGRECVQVGRLLDGVFGQVQAGRFRPLPGSAQASSCATSTRGPLVTVTRRPSMNVTLVYGLAVDRTPVSIRFGTLHRRVKPAGFGAFVAVFAGAQPREPVVVRSRVAGRLDVQTRP